MVSEPLKTVLKAGSVGSKRNSVRDAPDPVKRRRGLDQVPTPEAFPVKTYSAAWDPSWIVRGPRIIAFPPTSRVWEGAEFEIPSLPAAVNLARTLAPAVT